MGSFPDRTDKQEAESFPKQMKECDTRIRSGAAERAQWVMLFAAKPEFNPEPTWWKERMDSHKLFFTTPTP